MEIAEPIQKISSIDTKHEAMIHDAQYDYYGKRLATCSSDGYIKVFDVSKRENSIKLASFKAHNGPVWQLSWAHPKFGNILASCGFDKKVCVWKETKPNEWSLVTSHVEHQGSVNSLSWAPWECGLKLAACSSDGCLSILSRNPDDSWDQVEKFQAHDLGVNSVSWAPLMSYQELSGNSEKTRPLLKLASGSCDNSIRIWAYDSANRKWECIQKLGEKNDGHSDWVRDVAWCPAIGNEYELLASCSEDQKVILWKLYKTDLNGSIAKIETKDLKFTGPVWRVSWSLAGNMLAVSYANNENGTQVDVYQENEQGEWEVLSQVNNQKME